MNNDREVPGTGEPATPAARSGVVQRAVARGDDGARLDRWFRRHYPAVTHGLLEKWLRAGQVRVDGQRATAADRVIAGQTVRIPPFAATEPAAAGRPVPTVSPRDAAALRSRVLFRDEMVVVIDKPAGLAVQGGTGTRRHLDGMLDALRFGAERPRLVHRLDKDTSGVLVLARSARVAAQLAEAFRDRTTEKLYWALVVGVPKPAEGRISAPLAKHGGAGGERVGIDDAEGSEAVTDYRVLERAAGRAAVLALEPRTGRTHQLRVHCAALGTPILGDRKYGGEGALIGGLDGDPPLHLHARRLSFPHPDGRTLTIEAPLPDHLRTTWDFFGFSAGPKSMPPQRRPSRR